MGIMSLKMFLIYGIFSKVAVVSFMGLQTAPTSFLPMYFTNSHPNLVGCPYCRIATPLRLPSL